MADLPLDLPADLPPQYLHLMVKNDNWQIYPYICWQIYPPVMTSSGQEWQLADLLLDLPADLPRPVMTSSVQEWQFHIATVTASIGRSTGRSTPHQLSTDALSTITPHLADLPHVK